MTSHEHRMYAWWAQITTLARHLIVLAAVAVWGERAASAAEPSARLEHRIRECDRLILRRDDYASAMTLAQSICQLGADSNDIRIEARGLIRMAFVELYFGKWKKDWGAWRDRSLSLVRKLPPPSRARVDVLMYDGAMRATYFSEVPDGIGQLQTSLASALILQDDRLLAQVYYYLGCVLPFDGQDARALQFLRIGSLFAKEAGEHWLEFRLLERSLLSESSFDYRDPKLVQRLNDLAEHVGKKSPLVMDPGEQREFQRRCFKRMGVLVKLPTSDVAAELSSCLASARLLLNQCVVDGEWDQVEEYLPLSRDCAKALDDASTIRELQFIQGCLLARQGRSEAANEQVKPYIEFLDGLSRRQELNRLCQRVAQQFEVSGTADQAIAWYARANRNSGRDERPREAATAAEAYFENAMQTRELRNSLKARDVVLARTQFLVLAIPSLIACVWLWNRVYAHRKSEERLRKLVDQQTESLQRAKEDAEQQNRAKTEFLARVNHEIRNPLAAIIASSEMLRLPEGKHDDREFARETIQACTQNLLDSIDEVLDFTQIESGKLSTNSVRFSPRALMNSVRIIVQSRMDKGRDRQHATELQVDVSEDVPESVVADEGKLRQILINLAQNAVRHTSRGFVRLECFMAEDAGQLVLRVTDTGCGMTAEQQDEVFDQYTTGRDRSGTGLGLYICRAFAECMRGTIRCRSEVDAGTAITVEVPFRLLDGSDQVNSEDALDCPAKLGILVVDDEPINRETVRRLLTALGHNVQAASDWSSVESVLRSSSIDVVFLDLRMPQNDGFEIARRIQQSNCMPRPAIFALTGDATESARKQTADMGFDGFLPKPFTLEMLQTSLQRGDRGDTIRRRK